MKERGEINVSNPPSKPLMIFDGDCGFCRAWILRWKDTTGDRVDYAPSQEVASLFPEIPAEAFSRAVQLIDVDGTVCEGAEAVFRALAAAGRWKCLLWAYRRLPGAAIVSERLYQFISHHRGSAG
jgi:lipase maturation factor 1